MKNTCKIGFTGLFVALLFLSFVANAQKESDLSAFLVASKQDANSLIEGYTRPLIRGASYAMTGGWYNTAKTHKKLGVDFGVSATVAFTPASDNYFAPQLSSATHLTSSTTPGLAPTFMGPKESTTYTSTYTTSSGTQNFNFIGPEGLNVKKNFSGVPVPMIQVGIGLIWNTDLKIRFVPQVNTANSKVSMLGFGLMHDLKQYLPGGSVLPFDLSVLLAYNSVKGVTSLVNTDPLDPRPQSTDGKITYKLNSWVGQAIISKKFSVLTGYVGVGYGAVHTNVDVTGTFNFMSSTESSISVKDPFATDFKNNSTKLTAGLRLKFGPIYFVGDYTLQKYNALTVGFGASIR